MLHVSASYHGVKLDGDPVRLPVDELVTVQVPRETAYTANGFGTLQITRRTVAKPKPVYTYTPPNTTFPKPKQEPENVVKGNFGGKSSDDFYAILEVVGCGKSVSKQDYILAEILEVKDSSLNLKTKDVRIYPKYGSLS